MGFAWMPTYMIEDDVKEGRLMPLTLEGQNVHSYDVGIVYRQKPMLGPAGKYLLDLLKRSKEILPEKSEDLIAIYS